MTSRRPTPLDFEWREFSASIAFLETRLDQRSTIEWAIQLGASETAKRRAVAQVLNGPAGHRLKEPWRSAWRLIQESWRDSGYVGSEHRYFGVADWVQTGDRSGALIQEIVSLVKPIIDIGSVRNARRRPKDVTDLLSVSIRSGDLLDPDQIGIKSIGDPLFLIELGHELDAAVIKVLDTARRLGWEENRSLWRLGGMNRVYFVSKQELAPGEHEPDEFHDGIAPLVKLLYATVAAIIEIDHLSTREFMCHWKVLWTPIHARLWAALARDQRAATHAEVGEFLRECDDDKFWNLNIFPEVSELRSRRFKDLTADDQRQVLQRLRKKPPRSQWPKDIETARLDRARTFWSLREIKRIEIAGGKLPSDTKAWMTSAISDFEQLSKMARVDDGFPGTQKAHIVPANPDAQYDLLEGLNRIQALENAFSSNRGGWQSDPSQRAADWMRQPGRSEAVLSDLETLHDGGSKFPSVWDRFGWSFVPPKEAAGGEVAVISFGDRTLGLIEKLSAGTIRRAIEGISAWLDAWKSKLVNRPALRRVWFRIWPIAVDVTNAQQVQDDTPDLNITASPAGDSEPMDLDTLNAPAGKLIGVFLECCPSVSEGDRPFERDEGLREMRDAAISAPGRSGLIAKHRMIESIDWFLTADQNWAIQHLLNPLNAKGAEALALWRAVARKTRFERLLSIIGTAMAERVMDVRLGRKTRRSLIFSLTVESLHALREGREPAVSYALIQQVLRSVDDELRGYSANALQRFVTELAAERGAEEIFRTAVRPFLERVWPQERSLSSPSVARALADLPAVCGDAFAEAVDAIARFLVPFECWSMLEYGLYGEDEDWPKLSRINDPIKAEAFLKLLDLTIGTAERSVIPLDLADALDQIRSVAPQLPETQKFRRLAALARH